MNIPLLILAILGLALFEIVNSVDNAIVNADILVTMRPKARKWFLFWGLIFAVFVVRGLLPWLIVWAATPSLGPIQALIAAFSNDPGIISAVNQSSPILLMGGGIFLILLFVHWLFLEEKTVGLIHERFFMRQGAWFFAAASIILAAVSWFAIHQNILMAFGAIVGSTVFFITHGFKENAERAEEQLIRGDKSDIAKILYLEIIDSTFSIDGVIGAFAFTLSVPIIIIGNGIGAWVVRQLTVKNARHIKKYVFLKNGAMYSIFILGLIMISDAFGLNIPSWFSPVATFLIVAFFLERSRRTIG